MKSIDSLTQAVSKEEFKRATHVTEDDTYDDVLFDDYLQTAQEVVETAARRLMLARSVEFQCRATGWRRWWFPVAPVGEVGKIEWQNDSGTWVDLDLTGIRVEQAFEEPQLVVPVGFLSTVTDGAAIRVTVTAGHSVADRPRQLAQAVIMLAREWYDAGIMELDTASAATPPLSFGILRLIRQVRYARPSEYGAA